MLALLLLALAPQLAAHQAARAAEGRIEAGGRRAAELLAPGSPWGARGLAAELSRVPAAPDVLLLLFHEGAVRAEWNGGTALPLDERGQAAVLEAWRQVPPAAARTALSALAADPERGLERGSGLRLLGEIGVGQDLALLFQLAPTLDARPEVLVERRAVLRDVLDRILARDPRALGALERFFTAANEPWLGVVVQAVEDTRVGGRVELLSSVLERVPSMTVPALTALARLGRTTPHPIDEGACERVRALLDRPDARVVLAAARACGSLEDDGAASKLVALLSNPDGNVRRAADRALVELTGLELPSAERWTLWLRAEERFWREEADDVFRTLAEGEPTTAVQRLASLGGRRFRRHDVAREVVPCLGRGDPGLARLACAVLGQLGSAEAVPALEALLDDPDESLRAAAAHALERIRARSLPAGRGGFPGL